MSVGVADLNTPALLIDTGVLETNLSEMDAVLPGTRLRPHVKATKCTALARHLADQGHTSFCAATPREIEGLVAAGLTDDLLLANETLDAGRLGALADRANVCVAVDSEATIRAAAGGGVRSVLIDVNVGMPRCGCDPAEAGALADLARSIGLDVRGVMGYEGHLMMVRDRATQAEQVADAMAMLTSAAHDVGGDVISGGGTGTFDLNTACTEIQAGSYALMDTDYDKLGLPFSKALSVLATVVSVNAGGWIVADAGLKA
ncbi:MAG: alanine racemase, partial [Microthrixaceae bacterium]|nr:alanine racemase [Microthrixaceae bacterium]